MPFWHGPQTHQEAPGSSIAIQHEIKRQSPQTMRDELCAGAIRGAHVLGAVLQGLLACTHCPARRGGLPPWNPAARVRSSGEHFSVPVCVRGSGRCFLTSLIRSNTAFLTRGGAGGDALGTHILGYVFTPETIKHNREKKKRREMPSYEYALT